MEAKGRREIGQPIGSGLTADGNALVQFFVKGIHGFDLGAEFLSSHRYAKPPGHFAEDTADTAPEGGERQFVYLDKRQIPEKKSLADPEGKRLGTGNIMKKEKIRGHTAFTMGRLPVGKRDESVHYRCRINSWEKASGTV
jgi:hypothetical protein